MRASIRALAFGTVLASGSLAAAPAAASCIGSFAFTGTIQTCTVDVAGIYALDLYGAQGGGATGGLGARAGGSVALSVGDILSILIGGQGGLSTSANPMDFGHGGGGGTFLALGTTPLAVAGGGGGGTMGGVAGGAGQAGTSGAAGTSAPLASSGAGGTGGLGGGRSNDSNSNVRGGGGWSGGGGGGTGLEPRGGGSFLSGGAGGAAGISTVYDSLGAGGFGGGGGSQVAAGGGGGYSGGGAGRGGGGGGSFLAPEVTDDVLISGVRAGNGLATISLQAATVETPEPGSLGLLAGALGMLALRRRR